MSLISWVDYVEIRVIRSFIDDSYADHRKKIRIALYVLIFSESNNFKRIAFSNIQLPPLINKSINCAWKAGQNLMTLIIK